MSFTAENAFRAPHFSSSSLRRCCSPPRALKSSSRGNVKRHHLRRRRAMLTRAEYNALPSSPSSSRTKTDDRGRSSSSFTSTSSRNSPEEVLRRAEELQALVRDIAQVASSTGPAGVSRTVQAARAIFELGVKTIQSGNLERMTAPSALRQLFEALGATYIKFGQFIASTPSAFPKEFVYEFQKCLDYTPPVSFG